MKDIRNRIWIIILISGIILLISVLTPVTSYIQTGAQSHSWLWGFGYYNIEGYGSEFYFWLLNEPSYRNLPNGIVGILIAIGVTIGSVKLINIGKELRMNRIDIKNQEKILTKIGALMVIAPIIYVISRYIIGNLSFLIMGIESTYVLWGGASGPGFAFIGPFIGGALALISVIASKKSALGDEPFSTEEFKKTTTTYPTGLKKGEFKFCTECSQQLPKESKFCTSCGFDMSIHNK